MRKVAPIILALVVLCGLAHAQTPPALACKATETQPECHARLKCKASEEVEDCQKRLANAGKPNDAQNTDGNRDGDRDADNRERERERGDDRNDRGDRDNRRDDSDRDRSDRRDRDDGGGDRRRQRGSRGRSKAFEANKTFGLGIELGAPNGLNGKYFVSKSTALDFGIGFIYSHYYYGDGIHLYGDILWHPTSFVSAPAFELPFYVGVGLRYWDFDYCDRGLCTYGGSAVGVRVPVGISFDFNRVPLDVFIQLVPVIDFVNGDYYDRYRDRSHFGIDLSAGARYWFK